MVQSARRNKNKESKPTNPKFNSTLKPHLANGLWNKSLNFIFPTKYGIPKSLKPFSHWSSSMQITRPPKCDACILEPDKLSTFLID